MKFQGGIVLKCHVHSFFFVYSIILSMINSSSSSFHLTGKQTKIKHFCLSPEELSVSTSPVLRDINFEQSLTCFPNSTCSAEGLSRNVFVAFQATKKRNSIGMFAPPIFGVSCSQLNLRLQMLYIHMAMLVHHRPRRETVGLELGLNLKNV